MPHRNFGSMLYHYQRLLFCLKAFEAVGYGNLCIKCLFLNEKCNLYGKSTVQYGSVLKMLN